MRYHERLIWLATFSPRQFFYESTKEDIEKHPELEELAAFNLSNLGNHNFFYENLHRKYPKLTKYFFKHLLRDRF